MDTKTTIRDFYGRILGYVYEDAKGNKVVRDFYGRIIAKYDKSSNITRNFYNQIIGRGDIATSLLYNDKK